MRYLLTGWASVLAGNLLHYFTQYKIIGLVLMFVALPFFVVSVHRDSKQKGGDE